MAQGGMDKMHPPTTHGVFKPVGHALLAFRTAEALQAALQALDAAGFSLPGMLLHYSAEEMRHLAAAELARAGPLANFGYELDLLHHHLRLAEAGCVFLLVYAPREDRVDALASALPALQPVSAQHYGRFLIRDLTERPPGTA